MEIKPLLQLGGSGLPSHPMAVGVTVLRTWAPSWPPRSDSHFSGVPLWQWAVEGYVGEKRKSVWASRSAGTGTVLVHLAIIHCVPAVALCCINQLPREVLEIQNDLFQTPLHLAVYLEQPSVIQALIHKGVNPGLQDHNGNTPLHLACEQQHLRCAQQLLQCTPGAELVAKLGQRLCLACLHISTLKGNIPMMSLLLESGANINVREGTSGKTPLHLAVECHNHRAVQFLLRNGAYVDAQMYNGCTPLHLAVGRKDAAIAAILSHSGADTLLRNMENETAQDLADGNDDLLALLPFDDLKISGKPVVCSE
uniref:NFKB inhibitor epsilon n=1 Tax=Athene cunicularia TaxID=194338 RepID=A0A663LPF3_ATHCN